MNFLFPFTTIDVMHFNRAPTLSAHRLRGLIITRVLRDVYLPPAGNSDLYLLLSVSPIWHNCEKPFFVRAPFRPRQWFLYGFLG